MTPAARRAPVLAGAREGSRRREGSILRVAQATTTLPVMALT